MILHISCNEETSGGLWNEKFFDSNGVKKWTASRIFLPSGVTKNDLG